MIRLILTAPYNLSETQKQAIQSVFAQSVSPMPGTIVYNNKVIIDSTVDDNFNLQVLANLELPFSIVGQWQWDGVSEQLITITPLDSSFNKYLPSVTTYIPHNFAGWPDILL